MKTKRKRTHQISILEELRSDEHDGNSHQGCHDSVYDPHESYSVYEHVDSLPVQLVVLPVYVIREEVKLRVEVIS